MKKIASFTVNHDTLEKGVYISRIDGDAVTYDIRMKKPNNGSFISPKVHTKHSKFVSPSLIVFVSVIAAHCMMNIYVHNNQLVEQPLKLGRIEA